MFVATTKSRNHAVSGEDAPTSPQQQALTTDGGCHLFHCLICGKPLDYSGDAATVPFDYFRHADGSADCFDAGDVSPDHRLATEMTVKVLYNRIVNLTGPPIDLDVERWIGTESDFVIADVRVDYPLNIAAEIVYESSHIALRRRLNTMYRHDYRPYFVIHKGGRHNPARIEQYLSQYAPLSVGRFDPDTRELSLGDLFDPTQIDLELDDCNQLPDYIF